MFKKRYGKLTALHYVGSTKNKGKNSVWRFKCVCGNEKDLVLSYVKHGKTTSCGCDSRNKRRAASTTHGHRYTAIYRIWMSMKNRCSNHKRPMNKNYGMRGIKVCARWRKFENFLVDMGNRPTSHHTIERIDCNKGYNKKNCIWLHKRLQARNTRKAKWFTIGNKRKRLIEWCEYYNVPYGRTWERVYKTGWSIERALKERVHIEKRR